MIIMINYSLYDVIENGKKVCYSLTVVLIQNSSSQHLGALVFTDYTAQTGLCGMHTNLDYLVQERIHKGSICILLSHCYH